MSIRSPHLLQGGECAPIAPITHRVRIDGKFFRAGDLKWYVKGFSYGPFRPQVDREYLPSPEVVRHDFALMRDLGGNALRVYYPPPTWLLDAAADQQLRVFIDVPWEKHRCFFEDWDAQKRARDVVRETARHVGDHPAVFAISVVNEIPADVVRFYGHPRVERFVNELIYEVKEQSPDCLATCVNFPTTEFFNPAACDFACFNVYLHDADDLGRYLDRLQHIAGSRPLVLGEYGADSIRQGELDQAVLIEQHIRRVFRHGLAGSFVFAYTDDWYTGGHQITDWAFGVTRADRSKKLAATRLRATWSRALDTSLREPPRVSVVVCSYNGATTLRECLESLMRLDYPDFEVILVDDGSTDNTPEIARDFPQVICIRQENRGLSVARNVGAQRANGEIIAYTDSDCVVDEHWLHYLVQAMEDQQVEAIGGPNLTPRSDGWVAKCIAASPGNPSHVMLDDHLAEHVPGCNLAIRRNVLLALGGFDPQFRQAGDDVDLCWRLLDGGLRIGYSSAGMVWHHRRATVRAYFKQQQGYGRSEAMVHFKHPRRCGAFGRSRWRGIIYGDGAVGLPLLPDTIYHGRFGLAPYQSIYRHNEYGVWSCMMSLEWHLLAIFLFVLAVLYWPLGVVGLGMWTATLSLAVSSALKAPLPGGAPRGSRPLVAFLYLAQPIVRGWYRQTHLLRILRLPRIHGDATSQLARRIKRISPSQRDLYWYSDQALGREQLLDELVKQSAENRWLGDFDDAWSEFDVKLVGDRWHDIRIRTATEELGWPQRFTRARTIVSPTYFSRLINSAVLIWTAIAIATFQFWGVSAGVAACTLLAIARLRSRRSCFLSAKRLLVAAGEMAGLCPVDVQGNVLRCEATAAVLPNGTDVDTDQPQHDSHLQTASLD